MACADRRVPNLLLLADMLGVRVESAALPPDVCGLYDDRRRLIIILDGRLNQRQEACTLRHELFHAQHHDPGCGSEYGVACERRCRREIARALISPSEYAMAERMFDADPWHMAVELGVTMQVLKDYQTLLEQRVRYGAEMVGQQS